MSLWSSDTLDRGMIVVAFQPPNYNARKAMMGFSSKRCSIN